MSSDSGLPASVVRRGARGEQAAVECGVARFQEREEASVETHQFFPVVEVREVEAEAREEATEASRKKP